MPPMLQAAFYKQLGKVCVCPSACELPKRITLVPNKDVKELADSLANAVSALEEQLVREKMICQVLVQGILAIEKLLKDGETGAALAAIAHISQYEVKK